MDFVQRNLINERNNLQVELAKAKILIAQLSEDLQTPGRAKEVAAEIKKREIRGDPVKGLKRLDKDEKGDMGTLIGRGGKETPAITKTGIMLGGVGPDGEMVKRNKLASHGGRGGRSVGIGKGEDSPQNMSEQAEYISGLENVIASIAESMNMSVEDLLNEVRAVNDNELTTNSGIMKNARNINRVRGVMDRIHNRTQSAGHNAVGTAKDAYDSERGSHMLNALGVKAEVRSSGVGVKVPSQRSPTEAFTAGTHVKMGSNNQSDRAVGALRANNMSSNRANRPTGPVADTTKKSSVGTTILPGY
jgi:hypothetical protein